MTRCAGKHLTHHIIHIKTVKKEYSKEEITLYDHISKRWVTHK